MAMTFHMQGSGLYHFRGSVIASRSFCELTALFTVSWCASWLKKIFPYYPPSITTTLHQSLLPSINHYYPPSITTTLAFPTWNYVLLASFPGPVHGESMGTRLMLCWNESLFSTKSSCVFLKWNRCFPSTPWSAHISMCLSEMKLLFSCHTVIFPRIPLTEHEHRCMLTPFHWWTLNSSALQLWPPLSLASWRSLPTFSTTAATLGGAVRVISQ